MKNNAPTMAKKANEPRIPPMRACLPRTLTDFPDEAASMPVAVDAEAVDEIVELPIFEEADDDELVVVVNTCGKATRITSLQLSSSQLLDLSMVDVIVTAGSVFVIVLVNVLVLISRSSTTVFVQIGESQRNGRVVMDATVPIHVLVLVIVV
ncbi:hypothetical protein C8R43DRAFT_1037673, partial [Mycena crocata]